MPSSREAVDCDSAWNELLREQVPNLFLQALHSFRGLAPAHADLPMAWVNRWLQSIPLPREVQLACNDSYGFILATHVFCCLFMFSNYRICPWQECMQYLFCFALEGCNPVLRPDIGNPLLPLFGRTLSCMLRCLQTQQLRHNVDALYELDCHATHTADKHLLTFSSGPLQAQSFFAALPHSLAARLQQSQCIPTEANHWVYPREALVCQDPQVRALLADARLPAVVTLQYAHSGLSVLHSSQPLRALLGVGEVAHGHLLDVVCQLHASSSLAQMGQAWLAQLLLCVFDSLQQEQPGGYGAPSHGARATAAVKAATADLKQVLLLPLSDGSFATVENQRQQPTYFPIDMDDIEGEICYTFLFKSGHCCHNYRQLDSVSLLSQEVHSYRPLCKQVSSWFLWDTSRRFACISLLM